MGWYGLMFWVGLTAYSGCGSHLCYFVVLFFKRQLLNHSGSEPVLKVVAGIPGHQPQTKLEKPSAVVLLREGAGPCYGERLGGLPAWWC